MIRIPDTELPKRAQTWLTKYQREIDEIRDYAERVKQAKDRFKTRNAGKNATFQVVRDTLSAMCSGARRCMYCEDSCADEIEHVKPKDLYPESVFVWKNYLYACGPCNGPKNNKYAVISRGRGELVDVTRKAGDPVVPPIQGDPALLDPRSENPLDFLELDLVETFLFLPRPNADARADLRAKYTIETLRLNRDLLLVAREEAYGSYRARLSEYIQFRDSGAPQDSLVLLISALRNMGHPTVWWEMKRQRDLIDELHYLFATAPEALNW